MRPSTAYGGGHAVRRRKADCLHELYMTLAITKARARPFWGFAWVLRYGCRLHGCVAKLLRGVVTCCTWRCHHESLLELTAHVSPSGLPS
jgi:hypothetical protein